MIVCPRPIATRSLCSTHSMRCNPIEARGFRWVEAVTAFDSAPRIPARRLEGMKMAPGNRRVSIVVAMSGLAILTAVGRDAKADALKISKGGIVVVGGSGNGTDPAYTYQFEGDLQGKLNAFSLFSTPSSITVDHLVGVYPLDLTGTAPAGWIYSIQVTGVPTFSNPYFTSNVTWTYVGLNSITAPPNTTLDLGLFTITTESNLPGGYAPGILPTTITYNYSIDGGGGSQGGSGTSTVSLQQGGINVLSVVVPEPSTAIAPLTVILGLPLVILLKRRRAMRASRLAA